MLTIQPTGKTLGATVEGANLSKPLSDSDFATIFRALGAYGVLRFPNQDMTPCDLRDFSSRFGDLQVMLNLAHDPDVPEVSILSNIAGADGKPIGIPDAGQEWHTDMTYNETVGFVNVLAAYEVPKRDGRPLGATEFANTQAAYADLSVSIKEKLKDATATHDLNKYREYVRQVKGSKRPPLSKEDRKRRPPVSHPVFLTHPITSNKVIYVNPAFTVRINELEPEESDEALDMLISHVFKDKYRYVFNWTVGDVLVWDHIGTWHNAVADYAPTEHRLMKRCQVLAMRVFDPEFRRGILANENADTAMP